MNEILIVPDIHGRNFWEPALDYPGKIIFLGDYTDPYSYERFTQADAYDALLLIMEFKEENPNRVTLLVGNHELHYYNKNHKYARYSYDFYEKYNALLTSHSTEGLFQLCKKIENYLFIHAGVTKGWYDEHRKQFIHLGNDTEEQLNKLFILNKELFADISFLYRGGIANYGSPIWADVRELLEESEHFDNNLIQVVGHTQSDELIIEGNIRMLDNRKLYLLKSDEFGVFI